MHQFSSSLVLLFLIYFSNGFAQEIPDQKKVKTVIIYKGCQNEKTNNDLQKCFSNKLLKIIDAQLGKHNETLIDLKIKEFTAKMKFAISREGKIENIEFLDASNPIFEDLLKQSFENTLVELKEIKPAIDFDNNPVALYFVVPVKWYYDEYYFWMDENTLFRKNPRHKEQVYYLLKSDDKTFEVRITRDYQFHIYEKNEHNYVYLGKAMNLYEVETMNPYKDIIEEMKKSKKLLKGEGNLDGELYQVFINSNNAEWEVYKNQILIDSFKSVNKFSKSKYVDLIYRN